MKDTSKQLLSKNKKLFPFHSGGGCVHFGYETDHEDLIWLINKADLHNPTFNDEDLPEFEWINEYPEDINDFCMFGLDFNNLDQEYEGLALNVIDLIENAINAYACTFESDGWSCAFYGRYQQGINILDELSPKIDQEIIKFCRC
tara:strand:- start:17986 stop:18420 length:435 start_codon:yes stop_codon:yes gene_type:complete